MNKKLFLISIIAITLLLNINPVKGKPLETNKKSLKEILENNIKYENTNIDKDNNTLYITGKNPNNYLYYSGKLWQIINIDLENNYLTLITNDNITDIRFNTKESYIESDARKWLNNNNEDGFLKSLYNYQKYLVKSNWNTDIVLSESDISNSKNTKDYVSLLSIYDLSQITDLKNIENSYINNFQSFYLSNTKSNTNTWYINEKGELNNINNDNILGIRPIIKVKTDYLENEGTIENPFSFTDPNNEKPLFKKSSGEFIKFNNELYQITYIKNKITTAKKYTPITKNNEIIKMPFSDNSSLFDKTDKNNIGYYLNTTYYMSLDINSRNMLEDTDIFLGSISYKDSYLLTKCKNTSCNSKNVTTKSKISLIEYGTLHSSNTNKDEKNSYWMLTPFSNNQVYITLKNNTLTNQIVTEKQAIIPTINLKKEVEVTKGTGTINDPYLIKLKEKIINTKNINLKTNSTYNIKNIYKEINYKMNWDTTNKNICYVKNNKIFTKKNGTCTLSTSSTNYKYKINIKVTNHYLLTITNIIIIIISTISILLSIKNINKYKKMINN